MKRIIFLALVICGVAYADTVITNKDGKVTTVTGDMASLMIQAPVVVTPPPPPPAPTYILTLASPAVSSTVTGTFALQGTGPGFLNVEVFSASGVMLGRATPDASGIFKAMVDSTQLSNGVQTLTINAWDSAAGTAFTHSATTTRAFTVSNAVVVVPPPPPSTAKCAVKAGFTQTYCDNFDTIDLTKYMTSFYFGDRTLSSNGEREYYVDPTYKGSCATAPGTNPFSVTSGVLQIQARPATAAESACFWGYNYVSGLLTTEGHFSQVYGYFEIRMQTPDGQGTWPAFWLLPDDKSWPPEEDVTEQSGGTEAGSTVDRSTWTHYGSIGTGSCGNWVQLPFNTNTGMHTYGLDWESDLTTWYVDGVQIGQCPTIKEATKPMYMLINLAIGGNWFGTTNLPTAPVNLLVDYVAAYQRNSNVTASAMKLKPKVSGKVQKPGKKPYKFKVK